MNTVDKTPEQIDFDEKIKKIIAETPESNWYRGSFSGVSKTTEQMIKEWQSKPWVDYEELQLLPKPDFHLIALEQAGRLKNDNLEQLLGRAEEIEKWLREPEVSENKRRLEAYEEQKRIMTEFYDK